MGASSHRFRRGAVRLAAAVLAAVAVFPPVPAEAVVRTVSLRDCAFDPVFRAIDVGDRVQWSYDESGTTACAGQNHRIESFSSPPPRIDSGACDSAADISLSCMNDPPKKSTFAYTFDKAGTYNFYCRFHGTPSGNPNERECGMCMQIKVVGPAGTPTGSATTSPRPTVSKTATATASGTATATPTGTATATPTSTVSPTATATATVLANDDEGGGGGGRAFLAIAAIGALGGAGYFVWRLLIAQR